MSVASGSAVLRKLRASRSRWPFESKYLANQQLLTRAENLSNLNLEHKTMSAIVVVFAGCCLSCFCVNGTRRDDLRAEQRRAKEEILPVLDFSSALDLINWLFLGSARLSRAVGLARLISRLSAFYTRPTDHSAPSPAQLSPAQFGSFQSARARGRRILGGSHIGLLVVSIRAARMFGAR